MIKELIFSGKKYFEGQVPNYIGKTITFPEKPCLFFSPTAKAGEGDIALDVFMGDGDSAKVLPANSTAEVVSQMSGQVTMNGNYKSAYAKFNNTYQTFVLLRGAKAFTNWDRWISLTELIQNGGVSSSPLTHIYQAFKRAFTRNEVIACL